MAAAGLIATIAVSVAAACGGGGNGKTVSVIPTLANAPIPTEVLSPTPTPVCGPQSNLPALPANFPLDIPKPEDAIVYSVQTTPYLKVVVHTVPPFGGERVAPFVTVGGALKDGLTAHNWTIQRNTKVEGEDMDIVAPDGRTGHVNALPVKGCPGEVQITYDFNWITG